MSEAAKAGLSAWLVQLGGIAEIADKIYHIFNASCDGPVAVDQISATGYLLDSWTAFHIHSETRYYTGHLNILWR
jgi:cystathionine beta-lyase/cystathionine gamma-synthase